MCYLNVALLAECTSNMRRWHSSKSKTAKHWQMQMLLAVLTVFRHCSSLVFSIKTTPKPPKPLSSTTTDTSPNNVTWSNNKTLTVTVIRALVSKQTTNKIDGWNRRKESKCGRNKLKGKYQFLSSHDLSRSQNCIFKTRMTTGIESQESDLISVYAWQNHTLHLRWSQIQM